MSKEIDLNGKTVVISRTDSIGDVLLTLPMVSWLKQKYPTIKIIFLGKSYTEAIVNCHAGVDLFLNWNKMEELPVQQSVTLLKEHKIDVFIHVFPNKAIAQLATKAKIPFRIGTSHRSFHFLTCNLRPSFTRRKSDLHEAQLNFNLLKYYGIKALPTFEEIIEFNGDFNKVGKNTLLLNTLLTEDKPRVILHARSQGSALEWGLDNYSSLAKQLSNKGFAVYYTGTEKEGTQIRGSIPSGPSIYDVTGKMTLNELITFISSCNALVACSTGPLHIAATLNKKAIGLYSPRKPIHPGRWMPLGKNATALVNDENCTICAAGETCNCIQQISVERVLDKLLS